MRSSGYSKHTLVIVLIACLLRGLLPLESDLGGDSGRSDGARSSEESPEFPCAGHACGCRTAEHCLTACCCAPVRGNHDQAVVPPSAEVAGDLDAITPRVSPRESPRFAGITFQRLPLDGIERARHTAFIEAFKCAGGSSRAVAAASSILSIESRSIAWNSIDQGTHQEVRMAFEEIASRRPAPSPPPPRESASRT
jgi:hypothetical protein